MLRSLLVDRVHPTLVASMEGKVIQARTPSFVTGRGHCGRLLDDQVGRAKPPAPAVRPVLEFGITKLAHQPPPFADGPGEVRYPEFDVMQRAGEWMIRWQVWSLE